MSWGDWVYLGAGGFLFGVLIYTGWITTKYEPEVKFGYGIIGAGVIISVVSHAWLEFEIGASYWFLIAEFIAYVCVTVGLILIVRERKRKGVKNDRRS